MHYVIGDIHGCYDEFIALKNRIEKKDSEAAIIMVGDIIDRGPKVDEMIEWAMKNANISKKYQLLMGNHEEMIIEWYDARFLPWWKAGGCRIDSKYMPNTSFDFDRLLWQKGWVSDEKISPIIDFFRELPLYTVIETDDKKKYVVAHAWAPRGERLQEIIAGREVTPQEKSLFLWERRVEEDYENSEYFLVHGHTPTMNGLSRKKAIASRKPNAINIDCGCSVGGRLCAVCLETEEEFYV